MCEEGEKKEAEGGVGLRGYGTSWEMLSLSCFWLAVQYLRRMGVVK